MGKRDIQVQALVQLMAAYLAQIIAPAGEKQRSQETSGIIQSRWIARTQLLVKLQKSLLHIFGRVSLDSSFYVRVFWHVVVGTEELDKLLVAALIEVIASAAAMMKAAFAYSEPGVVRALTPAIFGADVPATFRA